jgi:hypothetical protein
MHRHKHTLRSEPFAMKTIMTTIGCILVLAVSAGAATNYTVKSAGGGNYLTIQACATAMSAGDTCTVYAGTYNENVAIPAGSSGNYKTVTANGSDVVTVRSFTLNSHTRIIGNCPLHATIGSCGFNLGNPASPNTCVSVTSNSTDYVVKSNTMYACKFLSEVNNQQTTFGYIQNNTMRYSCSTSTSPNVCTGMTISGDHHLIEGNDISHVSDGIYIFGWHNVIRNNFFHDTYSTDCGSNSSNCHIDFIQQDANVAGGGQPTGYTLLEGNHIYKMNGSDMHSIGLFQGEACNGNCFNAIIRFNSSYHVTGAGIVNDNSTSGCPAWDHVKSYNNDWIDMVQSSGGAINNTSYCSTYAAYINDIYYWPGSVSNVNAYYTTGGGGSSTTPYRVGHNLAYCPGCTASSILAHTYGSGNFTDDPGNQVANPQFVNYAGNDFHLGSGSAAIGAGTYLTTASGSASNSTSLTVGDASFFQDGSGIPGVQADRIRIGTSTTVQISSVNYSTNVLTLASAVSWNIGDPIYIYKISDGTTVLAGNSPDLGAFPSTSTVTSGVAPPTSLTAVVQ